MTEEKKKSTGRKAAAEPTGKGAAKAPAKRPSRAAAAADDATASPSEKSGKARSKKPAKAPAERTAKQPVTRAANSAAMSAARAARVTAVQAAPERLVAAPAGEGAAAEPAAPVKVGRRRAGSAGERQKRLRITQKRSQIGCASKLRRVLAGLGLGRIGRTVTRPDNPAIRGMVAKVQHLVTVEEVEA